MIYLFIWLFGVCLLIGTVVYIGCKIDKDNFSEQNVLKKVTKRKGILLTILSCLCYGIVGGIPIGIMNYFLFATDCPTKAKLIFFVFLAFCVGFFIFCIGILLLGQYFENVIVQLLFLIVFVTSILGWTISFGNYIYNIEKVSCVEIVSTEKRNLVYFCNIPVQEILVNSANISGSIISTSDELPYWYTIENGNALYDTAEAEKTELVFILDEKNSYVEINTYCKTTKRINHNNGKEKIVKAEKWSEYIFYLPESIQQLNLN